MYISIYLYIYIYVLTYIYIYIYIYIYTHILGWLETRLAQNTSNYIKLPNTTLEGTEGVPTNGGRKYQLVWLGFTLNSVHVQTLILTDVQTPFFGTPLVPLKT